MTAILATVTAVAEQLTTVARISLTRDAPTRRLALVERMPNSTAETRILDLTGRVDERVRVGRGALDPGRSAHSLS